MTESTGDRSEGVRAQTVLNDFAKATHPKKTGGLDRLARARLAAFERLTDAIKRADRADLWNEEGAARASFVEGDCVKVDVEAEAILRQYRDGHATEEELSRALERATVDIAARRETLEVVSKILERRAQRRGGRTT